MPSHIGSCGYQKHDEDSIYIMVGAAACRGLPESQSIMLHQGLPEQVYIKA